MIYSYRTVLYACFFYSVLHHLDHLDRILSLTLTLSERTHFSLSNFLAGIKESTSSKTPQTSTIRFNTAEKNIHIFVILTGILISNIGIINIENHVFSDKKISKIVT